MSPGGAVTANRVGEVSEVDIATFQTVRPRLFGIGYRVLGSAAEADDVVQEAWIRWQGTERSKVRDAAAFLATTTTRLAINAAQSAHARHGPASARSFPNRSAPQAIRHLGQSKPKRSSSRY